MLYRILTEDSEQYRKVAVEEVSIHFDGFTMLTGAGYWKGKPEGCLVIEIEGNEQAEAFIYRIAQWIKLRNKQQAVMIQKLSNSSYIV